MLKLDLTVNEPLPVIMGKIERGLLEAIVAAGGDYDPDLDETFNEDFGKMLGRIAQHIQYLSTLVSIRVYPLDHTMNEDLSITLYHIQLMYDEAIAGIGGGDDGNYLTLGGEYLTLNDEPLTLGA